MFKKPEEWGKEKEVDVQNTEGIRTFLLNKFSHWHESYKQLSLSTTSFVLCHMRKISLDIPWKNNRPLPITLIGDAAHIMPPFAAQGVNIELLDALILSENLMEGKFETIEMTINDFEQKCGCMPQKHNWKQAGTKRRCFSQSFLS